MKLSKKKWIIILLFFLSLSLIIIFFPKLKNISQIGYKGLQITSALIKADTSSLDATNNRVNLLLLGVSGGSHEGSDLTDTMIFLSIDKTTSDVVMLSMPRDIWLDSLKAKINSAYHYGELQQKGRGFVLVKEAVREVLNQPVHYAAVIDFSGFIKVIDLLGGIDIKVDRLLDDYKYPIEGKEQDLCNGDKEYNCRFEHLYFNAGLQHMDGETALKFIRSRNALGEEGTDINRSLRQQKVIGAIKDKVFSYQVLLNPRKLMELKNSILDNIKFDSQLNQDQSTAFLSLFLHFIKNKNQIRTITLDYGDEDNPGFLYNPSISLYGQWVLIPQNNSWEEIHKDVEAKIQKTY